MSMEFVKMFLEISSILSFTRSEMLAGTSKPRGFADEPKNTRAKRVTWGEPLLEIESYAVTRYLVHIAQGTCTTGVSGFYFWHLGICEPPDVGQVRCGGALLKEYVVQTACHCIAHFSSIKNNETHMITTPRTVWEHSYAMYLGYFDMEKMHDGSRPTMFLHHQKCEKWTVGGVRYDYGIIISQKPLIKKHLHTGEAPVYTISELQRIFEKIQGEQRVCLLAGWGASRIVNVSKNNKLEEGYSRYLQHTWQRVMTYRDCYWTQLWYRYFLKHHAKHLTYQGIVNWLCGKRFGKFSGVTGGGDSGSPMTCDNEYVGLVTGGSGYLKYVRLQYRIIYMEQAAIRFTESENSAEYRRSFLAETVEFVVRSLVRPDLISTRNPKSRSRASRLAAPQLQLIFHHYFLIVRKYISWMQSNYGIF